VRLRYDSLGRAEIVGHGELHLPSRGARRSRRGLVGHVVGRDPSRSRKQSEPPRIDSDDWRPTGELLPPGTGRMPTYDEMDAIAYGAKLVPVRQRAGDDPMWARSAVTAMRRAVLDVLTSPETMRRVDDQVRRYAASRGIRIV
jgi:hypothetical protein